VIQLSSEAVAECVGRQLSDSGSVSGLLRERFKTDQAEHVISPNPEVDTTASIDVSVAGAPLATSVTYISSLQKRQGHLEVTLVQEQDRTARLEEQSLLLQSRTTPLYFIR
jgi:hypothetical protein